MAVQNDGEESSDRKKRTAMRRSYFREKKVTPAKKGEERLGAARGTKSNHKAKKQILKVNIKDK